ncbi:unnamed protein product, partial [Lampetra planeri]
GGGGSGRARRESSHVRSAPGVLAARSGELGRGVRGGSLCPARRAVAHSGAGLHHGLGPGSHAGEEQLRVGRHGGHLGVAVPLRGSGEATALLTQPVVRAVHATGRRWHVSAGVELCAALHALEHRSAPGRWIRTRQGVRGVWAVLVAVRAASPSPQHPSLGHGGHHLPPHRHPHRVHEQHHHGHPLPAHTRLHGEGDGHPPALPDGSLHAVHFVCLHAARGHAAQRHRLLVRPPTSRRHDQERLGSEPHRRGHGHLGHQHVGQSHVQPGHLPQLGKPH